MSNWKKEKLWLISYFVIFIFHRSRVAKCIFPSGIWIASFHIKQGLSQSTSLYVGKVESFIHRGIGDCPPIFRIYQQRFRIYPWLSNSLHIQKTQLPHSKRRQKLDRPTVTKALYSKQANPIIIVIKEVADKPVMHH